MLKVLEWLVLLRLTVNLTYLEGLGCQRAWAKLQEAKIGLENSTKWVTRHTKPHSKTLVNCHLQTSNHELNLHKDGPNLLDKVKLCKTTVVKDIRSTWRNKRKRKSASKITKCIRTAAIWLLKSQYHLMESPQMRKNSKEEKLNQSRNKSRSAVLLFLTE
jgi:hypothetical protein